MVFPLSLSFDSIWTQFKKFVFCCGGEGFPVFGFDQQTRKKDGFLTFFFIFQFLEREMIRTLFVLITLVLSSNAITKLRTRQSHKEGPKTLVVSTNYDHEPSDEVRIVFMWERREIERAQKKYNVWNVKFTLHTHSTSLSLQLLTYEVTHTHTLHNVLTLRSNQERLFNSH